MKVTDSSDAVSLTCEYARKDGLNMTLLQAEEHIHLQRRVSGLCKHYNKVLFILQTKYLKKILTRLGYKVEYHEDYLIVQS